MRLRPACARRWRLSVGVTVGLALAAAAGCGAAQNGDRDTAARAQPPSFDRSQSNFTPETVDRFRRYSLFWPGSTFDGEPLRVIHWHRQTRVLPGEEGWPLPEAVDFVYGSCEGTAPCPVVGVQVWPLCVRNLSSYRRGPGAAPPGGIPRGTRLLTVREAPALYRPDEGHLEIYTGDATVVVFGNSEQQIFRAAEQLTGANTPVGRADPLPRPLSGAVDGERPCQGVLRDRLPDS